MKAFEDSKSYRRLQKDVVKATAEHERKLDKGKLSLASEYGKFVIIVSSRATYPDFLDADKVRADYNARLEEAEIIKEERAGKYGEIVIRRKAHIRDMTFDFKDPEVSDICLIGHGSVNGLITDDGGKYFAWEDAAKAAKSLKQGKIEQRTCATYPNDLRYPVALGTFAVSHFPNVIAAIGKVVPLPEKNISRDHLFAPVYDSDSHILDQIEALNVEHHAPHRQASLEVIA